MAAVESLEQTEHHVYDLLDVAGQTAEALSEEVVDRERVMTLSQQYRSLILSIKEGLNAAFTVLESRVGVQVEEAGLYGAEKDASLLLQLLSLAEKRLGEVKQNVVEEKMQTD
eukprot:m.236233 g.236233  ORF g.236233 m.236233 type:complete len:113 (+) comp20496_c0_seq1:1898-2236(+)